MISGAEYINEQRKTYSLYVLQSRSIPSAADGFKAANRRVLWTARDGKKYKSATLAGATMPIHPHASPEDAVSLMAAPYKNNIPVLKGYGSFGTLLNPGAYGAARYTSVALSKFAQEVVLADVEVIPMMENYDGTLEEPKHFLPLVPLVLLNPSEGVAIGFASNILPRSLDDIITDQIQHLTQPSKKIKDRFPQFVPTNSTATEHTLNKNGNPQWTFEGTYEKVNSTTIKITSLPYGLAHAKYTELLVNLVENGDIVDYEDGSKTTFDINVKFNRGALAKLSHDKLMKLLGLVSKSSENLNVLGFDGQRVVTTTYETLIREFCDWRLGWYVQRYERLKDLLERDIQRYKDVILAIKKNVGSTARNVASKGELEEYLAEIGVVHTDYVSSLPVYRFTEEERVKTETKLKDALAQVKRYNILLSNEEERRTVYVSELKDVLGKYKKGYYNEAG